MRVFYTGWRRSVVRTHAVAPEADTRCRPPSSTTVSTSATRAARASRSSSSTTGRSFRCCSSGRASAKAHMWSASNPHTARPGGEAPNERYGLLHHLNYGGIGGGPPGFPVVAGASVVAAREARIDAAHPQLAGELSEATGTGRSARCHTGSGVPILETENPGRAPTRSRPGAITILLPRARRKRLGREGSADLGREAPAVGCEFAARLGEGNEPGWLASRRPLDSR